MAVTNPAAFSRDAHYEKLLRQMKTKTLQRGAVVISSYSPFDESMSSVTNEHLQTKRNNNNNCFHDDIDDDNCETPKEKAGVIATQKNHNHVMTPNLSSIVPLALLVFSVLTMALPAQAAGATVLQTALVAYIHYASLLVCVGAVMLQRCTVQANLSTEQEDNLMMTEVVLGVATIALLVSGYYRTVEFDKGLDFYIHEPIFWIKIILTSVWGGSSLFPSTIIINRYFERKSIASQQQQQQQQQAPISTALAARLNQVLNSELTALLFIPLTATLMARGVWYVADFPWQAGAALSALAWLGLSYKYGKDAFTWKDPIDIIPEATESSKE